MLNRPDRWKNDDTNETMWAHLPNYSDKSSERQLLHYWIKKCYESRDAVLLIQTVSRPLKCLGNFTFVYMHTYTTVYINISESAVALLRISESAAALLT